MCERVIVFIIYMVTNKTNKKRLSQGDESCLITLLVSRNVLTRRREYGTYLATARRHRRRLKMQKRDE